MLAPPFGTVGFLVRHMPRGPGPRQVLPEGLSMAPKREVECACEEGRSCLK